MRLLFATALVALAVCFPAAAQQDRTGPSVVQDRTGPSVIRSRVAPPPSSPQPPTDNPAPPGGGDGGHGDRDWHRHRHGRWRSRCDWWPGVYFPPAFVPIYSPSSFVGYNFTLPAVPDVQTVPAPAPLPAPSGPEPRKPNSTNAEQKARAGRFIGFGDSQFAKQSYLAALGRYKTAAETAPDLAEPYFRQAFARVALGQYEAAAQAFRRGLAIRSDWRATPFRLKDLYGDQPLPKDAHIENLAKAVETNPFDADLLLVLGLQLFFNGDADRAGVFLTRAAQLGGNETGLLNDLLPQPKPAGAVEVKPVGGKVVF